MKFPLNNFRSFCTIKLVIQSLITSYILISVGTGGGFVPVNSPQAIPQQVVVVTNTRWSPNPMVVTCPFCRANVTTSISSEPGAMAWIVGGLLCVFG